MISFPERVETWSGDTCGSGTLLSRAVTFYDTYTVEGSQAPFDGNVAETRVYTDPTTYISSGRRTYDNMGRLLTATDPAGLTTTIGYSPVVNWPDNGITSTVGGGYNHTTTALIDRHTGRPSRITDPNGKITDLVYDPLGRMAEIYLPGQAKSTEVPSLRFSYQITSSGIGQPTAPARTKTETLQSHTGSPVYLAMYQYSDGLGRLREAQQPGPNGGRVVTATTYDARGNVATTTSPFHNSSAAGTGLVNPNLATVPATHETTYDHLNRATTQVDKKLGTAWRQTATTYHGDRVTIVPPAGGTKTVSHLDVRGNTTRLDQYTSTSNPNSFQSATYTYDLLDQLKTVVDPAGNTWTNTYDLAGRLTQKTDPDSGTTTTHYDSAGRVAHTLDSRGIKISVEYDTMSRTIGRWSGEVGTGTRLASSVYDTLAKGLLTSSTRHDVGGNYTTAVTGYTDNYQPTGIAVTIPAAEGALAGTYGTTFTYDKAGRVASSSQPAAGGLSAETLTFGYDDNGYPTTMTGAVPYVAATSYYAHGPLHQLLLGATGKRVRLTNTIDQQTGRLDATSIDLENVPGTFTAKFGTAYRYDAIGNITSILGATDGTADQIECFRYDPLRRLTTAWTGNTPTTTACDQTPQRGGSIDPYWRSWEFDTVGNRATQTDHNTAGNTTWTYTHPAPGTSRPHALTSITATGPLATTPTRSFTYDSAGNTLTRHTETGALQQLEWDAEGRLDTLTEGTDETSYIYDAAGNRLISRAPDKTTLYLGTTELTLNAGATQPDGTRYYTAAGRTIAVRTHTGLVWSGGDHHGTEQIQINADNLSTNRKRLLPYGEDRTAPPSIFLGTRGFVGGTQDDTGLTHLSARQYDPTLGRFISLDPVQDLADPQQWNGYSYANNNPTTFSDPTGLYHIGDDNGHIRAYQTSKTKYKVVNYTPTYKSENGGGEKGSSSTPNGGSKNSGSGGRPKIGDATLGVEPGVKEIWTLDHIAQTAYGKNFDQIGDSWDRRRVLAEVWCNNNPVRCEESDPGGVNAGAELIAELSGYADAKDCVTQGSFSGCAWTALALIPIGGKAVGILGKTLSRLVAKFLRKACSFSDDTQVLMADGSTKPIRDLRVGDEVHATNPETGESGKRRVTHVWVHEDNLHTLAIEDGNLHTTDDHPFWSDTDHEWQPANALYRGDHLVTPSGTALVTAELSPSSQRALAYNLTVDNIHTYYVLAGNTPVLVHNTGPGCNLDASGWPIPTMNNCHACAEKIQEQIGGDLYRIRDAYGAPRLGPSKHDPHGSWTEHYAVIKDGIVYDGFTGQAGMPLDAYRAQWEYGQYLNFSPVG